MPSTKSGLEKLVIAVKRIEEESAEGFAEAIAKAELKKKEQATKRATKV